MVPLLPMDEQHSYAAVFRKLRDFDVAVREFGRMARDLSSLLDASLPEGVMMPAEWQKKE